MKRLAVLLLVAVSLTACGSQSDPGTVASTTPLEATTTTPNTAPATTSTTPTEPPPAQTGVWARVPHDEAVFGGDGNQWMWSVTDGGPGLVAVGSDEPEGDWGAAVWTSTDGLAWTRVIDEQGVFTGEGRPAMNWVIPAGPGLVAVGSNGAGGHWDAAVWTSANGLDWSLVPDDEAALDRANNQLMMEVAAGGPGLVAVGYDGPWSDLDAAVWTSTDGITWTQVPHDETLFGGEGDQWIGSVVAGGPGLVAAGGDWSGGDEDAAVWTSVDGLIWNRVPHDEEVFGGDGGQWIGGVVAGGPGIVAVGSDHGDAAAWTSPDGVTWARLFDDETVLGGTGDQWMAAITADAPGLVAVGSDDGDAAVWTSPDGLTWAQVPHDEAVFGGEGAQVMRAVTVGGPGLVAVGTDYEQGDQDAAVWYWTPD